MTTTAKKFDRAAVLMTVKAGQKKGLTLANAIAELNEKGFRTPSGKRFNTSTYQYVKYTMGKKCTKARAVPAVHARKAPSLAPVLTQATTIAKTIMNAETMPYTVRVMLAASVIAAVTRANHN